MTTPTFPTQPQPGGNDGYGSIVGAPLRRDTYKPPFLVEDTSGTPVPTYVVAHQVNVSQPNPSIYLPEMNVTPGDEWVISHRLDAISTALAGQIKSQIECQWYNSSNVMIDEDETPFKTRSESTVEGWWQPTIEIVVPPNAAKLHVVVKMQFVSPINSWAVWYVSYEQV
jgi:hypothetical protein